MAKKLTKEEMRELCVNGQPHPVYIGPRHYAVAKLYARGLTHREIGKELGISPTTASSYLHLVYCGLPVHTRRGLQLSFKAGLIQRRGPRKRAPYRYTPWFK
jgi:DNA-binding NarL/FixJ family response regulator